MLRAVVTTFGLTWLLLLLAISTSAQSPTVLDATGQPLRFGVNYYILPAATDTAGGLTPISRNLTCPQFAGQEPLAQVVSRGVPIFLTPRLPGERVVRENTDYSFVFADRTTCGKANAWQLGEAMDQSTDRVSIVLGERPVLGSPDWSYQGRYFKIVKNEMGLYTLEWCPGCLAQNCPKPRCGPLSISVQKRKRFLVLYGSAFPFVFRKA